MGGFPRLGLEDAPSVLKSTRVGASFEHRYGRVYLPAGVVKRPERIVVANRRETSNSVDALESLVDTLRRG